MTCEICAAVIADAEKHSEFHATLREVLAGILAFAIPPPVPVPDGSLPA